MSVDATAKSILNAILNPVKEIVGDSGDPKKEMCIRDRKNIVKITKRKLKNDKRYTVKLI